jgi:hypothetical protein
MKSPGPLHFLCPPGTRMLLEVTGLPEKLTTSCVGHVRGRFVVAQMPLVPESGRDALYQMLYPDNGVISRFLHEGTVVGFSARLIKTIQIPFPLIFLTYPKRVESHDLRKHRRVICCLPGHTTIGETLFSGMITDLSLSGCQFSVAFDEMPPGVAIDDIVELRCELFGQNGQGRLACSVKRVALSGKRLEVGLKFRKMPPEMLQRLNDYLQDALSLLG